MNRAKNEIVASIARAKLELDDALEDLHALPMVDPMVLGFVAHALNNYLHISFGTVELLRAALKKHPNREVSVWLDGLQNVTKRMTKLIAEMQAGPQRTAPALRFEKIDLVTLVGRACDFYHRVAARKEVDIVFEKPAVTIPKVRTDRIAVAAILDNLLSHAVKSSEAGQKVWVEIRSESDGVTCEVRDEGNGHRVHPGGGQRVKAKRAAVSEHSGYEMPVAAELVAQLGGDFWGSGEKGKAARHSFRLPGPRKARAEISTSRKAK